MKLWFLNQIWLLSLSGFLLSVSAGFISRMEAKPPKIDYLDTTELTVNCTFEPDGTKSSPDHLRLVHLILSKEHLGKRPRLLVRMDQASNLHYESCPESPSGPIFHGALSNDKHASYLSVTWTEISEDLIGSYVCEGKFLTKTGHHVSHFTQTTVVEKWKLSQAVVEEVKRLKNDLKTMKSCCSNLEAKFLKTQSWTEKMPLSVSYLEKTLLMSEPSEVHRNRVYYKSRHHTYDVSSAEAVCQTMGGYLVEVNDNDEFHFLSTFIETDKEVYYAFIAGRRNVIDDTWYWPRTNQLVSFTSWHDDEPNNADNDENCIEFVYYNGKNQMNDLPCTVPPPKKRHFICEMVLS